MTSPRRYRRSKQTEVIREAKLAFMSAALGISAVTHGYSGDDGLIKESGGYSPEDSPLTKVRNAFTQGRTAWLSLDETTREKVLEQLVAHTYLGRYHLPCCQGDLRIAVPVCCASCGHRYKMIAGPGVVTYLDEDPKALALGGMR